MSFKHFSTSEDSLEQIQDKSCKPSHLEDFSTWAIQANKQAGGVAKTWGMAIAKAIKAETFEPYMIRASVMEEAVEEALVREKKKPY